MGKKKPRPRRSFTPEFKDEIVGLCRRGDRSVVQVAKGFELTETAVRDWSGWPRSTPANARSWPGCGRRTGAFREDVDILRRATVTVHPFLEAEKQGGHKVKRAYELLQVSHAAGTSPRVVDTFDPAP